MNEAFDELRYALIDLLRSIADALATRVDWLGGLRVWQVLVAAELMAWVVIGVSRLFS